MKEREKERVSELFCKQASRPYQNTDGVDAAGVEFHVGGLCAFGITHCSKTGKGQRRREGGGAN